MFARLFAQIRSLPWWAQLILIPAYVLVGTPLRIVGWALIEMFGSAKSKTKKTLSPLLWPAAGIVLFLVLLATLGEQGMVQIVQQIMPAAILVGAVYVLLVVAPKIMFRGLRSPKKKGKR